MQSLTFTAGQLVTLARAQRGTTELPPGSNRQKFGAAYHLDGVPWCALFVWWCFLQLGCDLRTCVSSKLEWTPTFAQEAARVGWGRVALGAQQPGDVVFWKFGTMIDHVSVCTSRSSQPGYIDTIDGNTSTSSDNNGGAVMDRTRPLSLVSVILRPPYAPVQPAAVVRTYLRRQLSYRRLRPMLRGDDVKAVQRLVGAVPDGVYGPDTAAAVAVWQHKVRIQQDGVFGPASARAAGWTWAA